jgi:ring-1,2-phenylacetyl-CoA epoxidase subunit PaaE
MTPTFHQLRISNIRKETDECVSVAFEIPDELKKDYQYQSGQYLTLRSDVLGKDIRRSYSICSAPHENQLRVAIKQVPDGVFSTFANNTLKEGDELDVMTPAGGFTFLPEIQRKESYLLIGAGSGITPLISIAKTVLKNELNSDVTLVFGNKHFNSIIFREELEALKNTYIDRFRIIHVLSRESLGNELQKGRISGEKINALFKAFFQGVKISEVFICGPETMILESKSCLEQLGILPKNIHFELFTTNLKQTKSISTSTSVGIASNVSIILDGDRLDLHMHEHDESILDVAQKAGADLPYACKGGVCCTCKAKILKGTATMDVNYALEADEVEAGYILTCQAHPTSDELLISFDE